MADIELASGLFFISLVFISNVRMQRKHFIKLLILIVLSNILGSTTADVEKHIESFLWL